MAESPSSFSFDTLFSSAKGYVSQLATTAASAAGNRIKEKIEKRQDSAGLQSRLDGNYAGATPNDLPDAMREADKTKAQQLIGTGGSFLSSILANKTLLMGVVVVVLVAVLFFKKRK